MKIVGQLVCGPGEADRYLEDTLKEFKRLTDETIVCLCNAGEKEKELVERYGFQWYEDNREWGKWQYEIKTALLSRIRETRAEYVLALDADESVPTVSRGILEELSGGREACQFFVINLWNDEAHYSKALSFWNVRFYKLPSEGNSQFARKPVHCGNAPPVAYSIPAAQSYVPHILLHKGLMRAEDRQRKVERYARYDPEAVHKGREYYEALKSTAPGDPYDQGLVLQKVSEFVQGLRKKQNHNPIVMATPKKHVYVRRLDTKFMGSVVDIPADSLAITLKNHPTWQVVGEEESKGATVVIPEAAPSSDPLECPICGQKAATLAGRKAHERIRHK